MSQFNGKWELVESDHFEEYMVAIGVDDAKRADAHKFLGDSSKMAYEIAIDGASGSFKVATPAGEKEIKFKFQEEFDTVTLDGRPIKATFSLDGDKLVEKQTGPGFETTNVRTVDGDVLTLVMTGNGVTCTRRYKKI